MLLELFSFYRHIMLSGTTDDSWKALTDLMVTPVAILEAADSDLFKVIACNALFLDDVLEKLMPPVVGKNLHDIFPDNLLETLIAGCNNALINQQSQELELITNSIGESRYWKCLITCLANCNRKRLMITFVEIREKKTLSNLLIKADARFKAIVMSAHDGILSINTNEKILFANEAAHTIFGTNELVGKQLNVLIPKKYRSKHSDYVHNFRNSEIRSRPMYIRSSVMGLKANGNEIPLEVTIAKIDTAGDTELIAVIRDVTERKQLMDQLNRESHTDTLTELFNRRYLEPLLAKEFDRAKRYTKAMSLLFVDIDNFKNVNDTFGHLVGDIVLKNVADVLKNWLREIDISCRWGGEEFVVLLPETDANGALLLADRLRLSIEQAEISHNGVTHQVTVSIGISELRESHTVPEQLVEDADNAMLEAKKLGKNRVHLFSLSTNTDL